MLSAQELASLFELQMLLLPRLQAWQQQMGENLHISFEPLFVWSLVYPRGTLETHPGKRAPVQLEHAVSVHTWRNINACIQLPITSNKMLYTILYPTKNQSFLRQFSSFSSATLWKL
jgi:hypothetical protein